MENRKYETGEVIETYTYRTDESTGIYGTGEVIETYTYRTDESTGILGIYGYNTSSLIMFLTGTVIIVGIICYWLGKKKK